MPEDNMFVGPLREIDPQGTSDNSSSPVTTDVNKKVTKGTQQQGGGITSHVDYDDDQSQVTIRH